ncbi:aggregation factor core [Cognatishimia sp. D5M38]|uniref:Aggregation factor core n=1 Tax=Cognatishimia coralii TaxID=3083254 RepID=A0ABU8QI88_9RHOB
MRNSILSAVVIGTIAFSSPALAEIRVEFIEGAPKDRFVFTNFSDCDIGAGIFKIDFTNSNAGLIFDVSGSGAGVEVFQPFELTSGAEFLTTLPIISDGDQLAVLDISGLKTNASIAFTIDVDDTLGARAITVSDSEISGTTVSFQSESTTVSTVMEEEAEVKLSLQECDA